MTRKLIWIGLGALALWWLFLRKPPAAAAAEVPSSPPPPAPVPQNLDAAKELLEGTPVDPLSGKPYSPALTATT